MKSKMKNAETLDGYWLPKKVWKDKNLSQEDKALLVVPDSHDTEHSKEYEANNIWIPIDVWGNKRLSLPSKVMWTFLDNAEGEGEDKGTASITNERLFQKMCVSVDTFISCFLELIKTDYINDFEDEAAQDRWIQCCKELLA